MLEPECPPCWFILPESNGPISVGVCKFCGVTKDCSNSGQVTSHFKVAGKVGLEKKHRKDAGDFWPGGDKVLGPKGE